MAEGQQQSHMPVGRISSMRGSLQTRQVKLVLRGIGNLPERVLTWSR